MRAGEGIDLSVEQNGDSRNLSSEDSPALATYNASFTPLKGWMEMPRKLLGMGPLLRALVPYQRIFGDNAHPSRVNFKTVWESW